jgi:hypothetical protein
MIVASSNTTIPIEANMEFRLHKYSNDILNVKYYRPEAGHTAKYSLKDFLEITKDKKYTLCITLNLRDDLGGKNFRIRPIEEYVDVASQVSKLAYKYSSKLFINLFSEPIYRYKISVQTAVDYILAVHHVIGDNLLAVPGEEINLLLSTPGFIDKITSLPIVDILAVHDLTPTLEEINHVKAHWSGRIAQLETGSQQLNYDRPEVADFVYNIFQMYYNAGVWWCGLVYVDSWTDRNYAARWWDYNYNQIEHVTPTYYAWLKARRDFMEGFELLLVKPGSKNEETRAIQQIVNDEGADPPLVEDGIYGSKTKAAILKWQTENGLVVDGIVGKQTWQWILEEIPSGQLRFNQMLVRKGFQ